MPPKKKDEEESKVQVLGRPGNHVKMGIVGLPNVGKSSFFNTLSKLNVPMENRPFCTIDPNVARVPVPDARFDALVAAYHPRSEVPAVLTVTDIAGLVAGAAEGAGLGNEFLSHIQAVDGVYHMLRCFKDPEVIHVDGSVDPIRDAETIHSELRKKDLQNAQRELEASRRAASRGGAGAKERQFEFNVLEKVAKTLEDGMDVRAGTWSGAEIEVLNKHLFMTAKPMIYLANLSERDFIRKANKWLPLLAEWTKGRGAGDLVIPFSVEFEQALLAAGSPEAAAAMEKEKGAKSMLPRILKAGYRGLHLQHFFTAGEDEVRAWTVRVGTKAPQAAGVIHTDFEKGFICADAFSYADFVEHGDEAAIKAAGKLRTEGRKYVVSDGDILHFKFNTGGGKKK